MGGIGQVASDSVRRGKTGTPQLDIAAILSYPTIKLDCPVDHGQVVTQ